MPLAIPLARRPDEEKALRSLALGGVKGWRGRSEVRGFERHGDIGKVGTPR